MTDILRDARRKMQSKAERFIAGDKPGKVDCSDYTPEALDVESNEKNSGQPNNPRMRYKRGGTVVAAEGDKPKQNAGKRPRSGNKMRHDDAAEDKKLIDKIVKPEARRDARKNGGANWIADATKHKGALHKALGVPAGEKIPEKKMAKAEHSGNPHVRKMANLAETLKGMSHRSARASGGHTARSTGGDIALAAASPAAFAAKELGLFKDGGRAQRAEGGKVPSWYKHGQYVDGGTRKSLEMGDAAREAVKGLPHKKENGIMVPVRDKRASGGRTKGKTNINIIIGAGGGHPRLGGPPPMMPPIGAAPVAPPPEGALPPQGAPAAPPPMGMPRKDGGRTIKMEYGAGSGKGRLEKAGKY